MCVSGFSQRKIIDFFKIKKPNLTEEKCDSPQGAILIIQERTSLSVLLKKFKNNNKGQIYHEPENQIKILNDGLRRLCN